MTIEQRVAKLDWQSRWMRRAGGVMLAAVACLVLIGKAAAEDEPSDATTGFAHGQHRRGLGGRHLRASGGTGRTEHAVVRGLAWLAANQKDDGHWGDAKDDGLALLAFLGAGHTDRGSLRENKYSTIVQNGLRALMTGQADSGDLRPRDIRSHAIATLALCEAYWLTKDTRYKVPAQKALRFLNGQRTRQNGTWSADLRTNLWCVLALQGGRFGGFQVDPAALPALTRWAREGNGQNGSDWASLYLSRIWLGTDPRAKPMRALAKRITTGEMTTADDWMHGTQALFQTGGGRWIAWNKVMKTSVIDSQHRNGSWGSVADTARYTMCLEVYYRYARFFARR